MNDFHKEIPVDWEGQASGDELKSMNDFHERRIWWTRKAGRLR